MPLESSPPLGEDHIPAQTLPEMETQWAINAAAAVAQALHEKIEQIAQVGETIITAGQTAANAILRIGEGMLAGGTEVISQWVGGVEQGGFLKIWSQQTVWCTGLVVFIALRARIP